MISDLPSEWFSWHGLMSALGLLVYALGSHALNQRRHPAAAIGWVMVIVLLPEVGVPLYLLFGTRKLPKAGRRLPVPARPEAGPEVAPAWVQRLTAAMGLPPPRGYRRLAIHADGCDARDALFAVVDSARERLDVCTFILGRDAFGDELLRRLIERAQAGVTVRLLVDGMGTWMGGRQHFGEAIAAGVQVAQFVPPLRSPFRWPLRGRTNLRNHRKLVVADADRLWSGGRNLAGEYFDGGGVRAPWTDLSFDLQGDVAAEAAAVFDSDWGFAQSPMRDEMGIPAPRDWPSGGVRAPAAQLLPSGPDYADDTVHTLLLTSCYRARNRILIVTPYLVPDESLLSALCLAARRGVAVDIIVPARSNHRLADISRHRPMRELARAGARLWLSPLMVHAKAVVIDEHMAMAGSVNLDSRSLFLNYELMVGFYSGPDIARFAAWMEALQGAAQAYIPREPGLARYVGEGLVLWLAFQI
ncbi:MAG: phospholipase D-like domain-containing protein [Burkholderiales bacterium]|nr:phospholipase D-like domain-containing protein [Burkholderiales bacterium]